MVFLFGCSSWVHCLHGRFALSCDTPSWCLWLWRCGWCHVFWRKQKCRKTIYDLMLSLWIHSYVPIFLHDMSGFVMKTKLNNFIVSLLCIFILAYFLNNRIQRSQHIVRLRLQNVQTWRPELQGSWFWMTSCRKNIELHLYDLLRLTVSKLHLIDLAGSERQKATGEPLAFSLISFFKLQRFQKVKKFVKSCSLPGMFFFQLADFPTQARRVFCWLGCACAATVVTGATGDRLKEGAAAFFVPLRVVLSNLKKNMIHVNIFTREIHCRGCLNFGVSFRNSMMEGAQINLSLSALGNVINALTEKSAGGWVWRRGQGPSFGEMLIRCHFVRPQSLLEKATTYLSIVIAHIIYVYIYIYICWRAASGNPPQWYGPPVPVGGFLSGLFGLKGLFKGGPFVGYNHYDDYDDPAAATTTAAAATTTYFLPTYYLLPLLLLLLLTTTCH